MALLAGAGIAPGAETGEESTGETLLAALPRRTKMPPEAVAGACQERIFWFPE